MHNTFSIRISMCLLFSVMLLVTACQTDEWIEASPQLVVEGWIDDGGFPIVMLTTTVPLNKKYKDVSTLEEHVIKWAKVTVSDGEKEVVLTGKTDENHFPPYIYTTGQLRGEAGKHYRLTVEYNNFFAEAETSIPNAIEVDSFRVTPVADGRFCQLTACFTDNPMTEDYYAIFCHSQNSSFRLSPQGLIPKNIKDTALCIPVYNPTSLFDKEEDYSRYFETGDSTVVKFVTMDSTSFRFWESFEEIRMFSRNPLFPVTDNMESNIQGGLGYWCGYGAKFYQIRF